MKSNKASKMDETRVKQLTRHYLHQYNRTANNLGKRVIKEYFARLQREGLL